MRGSAGEQILKERVLRFNSGEWTSLIREALPHRAPRRSQTQRVITDEAKLDSAVAQVKQGNLSRVAATLTNLPIAPGTPETHAKLTDPVRRPLESAEGRRLTAEDRAFEPGEDGAHATGGRVCARAQPILQRATR